MGKRTFGADRAPTINLATTPLDFGCSFSFLSYAGSNRVCCVADAATVPDPQALADLVHVALLEQMHDITSATTTSPPKTPMAAVEGVASAGDVVLHKGGQSTLRVRQPRELAAPDGSGPAVLLPYPRFRVDF